MRAGLTIALVATIAGHTAHADPDPDAPANPVAGAAKDPAVATELSIAGSLVGPAIALGGVALAERSCPSCGSSGGALIGAGALATLLLPSAGSWYAGKVWTRGLAVRTVAYGVGAGALALDVSNCLFKDPCDHSGPIALAVGAVALLGIGAGLDIHDAGDHARAYNQRYGLALNATLAPMIARTPDGATHGGLAVVGTF